MESRRASRMGACLAFLIAVCVLAGQSAGTQRGISSGASKRGRQGRFAGSFMEVEVGLSEQVKLSDISGLATAPDGGVEVLAGGERVKVQLRAESVRALLDAGAEVTVLRKFVIVEGGANEDTAVQSEVAASGACVGDYYYGESGLNVYIRDGVSWWGSGISFLTAPGNPEVTCIDVHCEVRNLSWSSIVDVALSDNDYAGFVYPLISGWWGFEGDILQTFYGIMAFNGRAVRQNWWLWAADYFADGFGYIDYWWIKLYYREPEPEYCEGRGDCSYEYIRDVVVGAINNSDSGCVGGYGDYTALRTTMKIGTGCPITVVNGLPDEPCQCGIWVDWNQDLDFDDAGEGVSVNGTPGQGPYTATITPPAGAKLGETRMRIRVMYTGAIEPCGATYGEVEDYTIRVVPESWLAGDFVEPDGVDMRDFGILGGQWQQAPGEPSADIAPGCGDGTVDWLDLGAFVENWLAGINP